MAEQSEDGQQLKHQQNRPPTTEDTKPKTICTFVHGILKIIQLKHHGKST